MITIVIPVHNGEETLENCLQALCTQKYEESLEIVVVNDGSVDRTGAIIDHLSKRYGKDSGSKDKGPVIRRIEQPHRGAAAARNRGVQVAQGEVILFTDADCVPLPGWVSHFQQTLLASAEIAPQGAVGRCRSEQLQWVAALIQVELDERYAEMSHHNQIDFLNTGNCAFHKRILLENPFDESFPWLEDVELSYRLAQQDLRLVFVPNAEVWHFHPESMGAYLKRKFHYASCAPEIYRRFPEKAVTDTRTPITRKLQLLTLAMAFLVLLFTGLLYLFGTLLEFSGQQTFQALGRMGLVLGIGGVLTSAAFSIPVVIRAFRRSVFLGVISPLFVLAGNAAFVLGLCTGLMSRLGNRPNQTRGIRP